MDDKIKEVMGLVKILGGKHYAVGVAEMQNRDKAADKLETEISQMERAIESKLRELVQSEQSLLDALKDIASGEILRSHCTGPHCVEEWGIATADEMASRAAGALAWHEMPKEPQ